MRKSTLHSRLVRLLLLKRWTCGRTGWLNALGEVMHCKISLVVTAGVCCLGTGVVHAMDCQSLVGKDFGKAHVMETEDVTGPITLASSDAFTPGHGITTATPFCRVRAVIKPTADSDIHMEAWLPPPSAWNGKYQSIGNGGFAGIIVYRPMAWALESGYAVSSTDAGHSGEMSDSSWIYGHPEKVVDLGWRAVHETAVASKALVAVYYGRSPAHSYFNGCSSGGREGLMEAQRFPTDYDGIVAGAPANYWVQAQTATIGYIQYISAAPGNWLSGEKLSLVNKASLAACHGAEGVLDDPGHCKFDPATLLCKKGQTEACLTQPEVVAMKLLYKDLYDAKGKIVYPGLSPGDEAFWAWSFGPAENRGTGSVSAPFAIGLYQAMVFQNPNWDFRSFQLERDLPIGLASDNIKAVSAENPDLSAFKAAGGRLLHYHGYNDPGIPARASILYYNSVLEKMGGVGAVDPFYRLFLGTGMRHCGMGPGPNALGGTFALQSPSRDPDHDLIAALANWVEDGVAPNQITATKYIDDDPGKGIAAQRPWCAYPKVAYYIGQGARNKASSYACSLPKQ